MEGASQFHQYGTLNRAGGFTHQQAYASDRKPEVQRFGVLNVVLVVGFLMALAFASFTKQNIPPDTSKFDTSLRSQYLEPNKSSQACSLLIGFSDVYTRKMGSYFHNYSFMEGVSGIVAAYQETTLTVENPCGDSNIFKWFIDGIEIETLSSSYNHTFMMLGIHTVQISNQSVSLSANTSTPMYSSKVLLACRYVRRETRTLETFDRSNFIDAVRIVYTVHAADGKKLYGSKYKDASYFIEYHTWMAGTLDCDHLHDGMGFLMGHNAITIEFEKNLQLINPAVTIPYWDYSIDMHDVYNNDKNFAVFYESTVINDDWFGPMGSNDHDFQVVKGKFANIPLEATAWNVTARVTNAWGRIRSPWNTAPQPYLIRSNKTYGYMSSYQSAPRCSIFYDAMNYSDIMTFTKFAQANAHGAIHTFIGGVSNADWKTWIESMDWFQGEGVALQGFGFIKNLWRKGYLDCPSTCSIDTEVSACACSCPNYESWDQDEALRILADVVGSFTTDTWYLNISDSTTCIAKEVLALMCGNFKEYSHPWLGDAMNSGATADPSFWVIHPNVDRLFQHRRMLGFTGLDVWPHGNKTDSTFYWGVGASSASCWGHQPNDTMIWNDLFVDDSNINSKYYTISELFEKMDAHAGKNTYVYDNFQWEHCTSEGIPADLKWTGEIGDDDYWASWSRQ